MSSPPSSTLPPEDRLASTESGNFFDKKAAAAVLKHALLEKYLPVFVGKTGKADPHRRVALLDGYSGPGMYRDGSLGSPALAATIAANLERIRSVRCLFLERDPRAHDELQRNFGDDPHCWIAPRGPIEKVLDQALGRVGNSPLFAFLDPFGLWLPFKALESRLLARSTVTEVLLRFDHITLARVAGNALGEGTEPRRIRAQETFGDRLDSLLGTSSWRSIWEFGNPSTRLEDIRNLFVSQLTSTGWHVVTVPVARGWERKPIYFLLFLTRSFHGIWSFNDACSLAMKQYSDFCNRDRPTLDLDVESTWIYEIRKNIQGMLEKEGTFDLWPHIYSVLGSNFGLARSTHIRRAIKQLHKEGLTPTTGIGELRTMQVLSPPTDDRSRPSEGPRPGARPTSGRRAFSPRPSPYGLPTA